MSNIKNKPELSDKTDPVQGPIQATGTMVLCGLGAYIKEELEKQKLIVSDDGGKHWRKAEPLKYESKKGTIECEKKFVEKYLPTFYSIYKLLNRNI